MGSPGSNTGGTVRIVVAILAIACFVIGGALTGAYLAVRHIVTTTAVGYAKLLGIALSPAEVRFGPTFVQLIGSDFAILDVPEVRGNVRRIDIDLTALRPTRVLLSGVMVNAKGNPLELRESLLRYWERIRPRAGLARDALPKLEWQHLALKLETGNAVLPTIAITELSIATDTGPSHDETTIRTATTQAGVFDLGALEVAVRQQNGLFELGWGPTLHEAKWRVAYQELPNVDQVRFALQPERVKKLLEGASVAAIPEAMESAKVGGHIEAIRDRVSGKATGSVKLDMSGFTPPLPPELKGYRFADKTTIAAQFDVDPLWFAMTLRGIEMKNGDISLVGHGRVDRELFSLRLRADLTTTLDCVTLARGYSLDEIGGALGQWGVKNAPKAVRGSVAVRVQVDADTSHLADAKVVKRIGIGCGLRPMSPSDLLNLGLPPPPDPKTLERVLQGMARGDAGISLGSMPNLLPSFGEILDASTPRRREPTTKTPTKPAQQPKR